MSETNDSNDSGLDPALAEGGDLLAGLSDPRHPRNPHCPGCGEDVSTTALTSLAYRFQPCDCDAWPYAHLVQRVWDLRCLVADLDP